MQDESRDWTAALQTRTHARTPSSEEAAVMYQRWKRTVTLSQEHETFAYFEGSWLSETHLFATGDDLAPIVTHGEAIAERLFGGRFLQMLYRGTMAVPAGPGAFDIVETEGLQTLGFDTYRNLFVGTWIDSLSTSVLHFAGTMCDDGDLPVLNLYGQQDEPMMGIVGRTVRYVYRLRDSCRFDLELHDLVGCHDHLVLKIAYTRDDNNSGRTSNNDDDDSEAE